MSEFDRLVEKEVRRILFEDRELLLKDIKEELLACEWLDQNLSILGRNRHVRLARRLIAEHSQDALHTDDGMWMVRRCAVDTEISRLNAVRPVPIGRPLPPVKTFGEPISEGEDGDDTGIYERRLCERMGVKP